MTTWWALTVPTANGLGLFGMFPERIGCEMVARWLFEAARVLGDCAPVIPGVAS